MAKGTVWFSCVELFCGWWNGEWCELWNRDRVEEHWPHSSDSRSGTFRIRKLLELICMQYDNPRLCSVSYANSSEFCISSEWNGCCEKRFFPFYGWICANSRAGRSAANVVQQSRWLQRSRWREGIAKTWRGKTANSFLSPNLLLF